MHGKISPSMYSGSMVGAGAMAFALMPYCIANARPDENCSLDLNPQLLASIFGETKEKVEQAIKFLCSPDPNSRSPDCEGRRLIHTGPGPFRYRVVNLEKYRADEERTYRTEYWRQHKQWSRGGRNGVFRFDPNLLCPQQSTAVHPADADADAGTDQYTHQTKIERPLPIHKIDLGRIDWLKERLEEMYNRPKGRRWGCEDEHLLVEIVNRPDHKDELGAIKNFRPKCPARSFPQSLLNLLKAWESTLDRARNVLTYDDKVPEMTIAQKDHQAAMRRIAQI